MKTNSSAAKFLMNVASIYYLALLFYLLFYLSPILTLNIYTAIYPHVISLFLRKTDTYYNNFTGKIKSPRSCRYVQAHTLVVSRNRQNKSSIEDRSSCFRLLHAWITGICHYIWHLWILYVVREMNN